MELKSKDRIAGPRVLAGFIEAAVSGPPTKAHIATVVPIARPANSPTALESVATLIITNIKEKLNVNSIKNPELKLVLKIVFPNPWALPKIMK